jgi:transposase
MDNLVECAAGLDVHRDTVVASVRRLAGKKERVETRTFETFPDALRSLGQWLKECGVQIVGMESTGVYFFPVYRELKRWELVVWVVNAAHAKNVPGRKTDVSDSAWLSKLVMHGLVRPSFIPDETLESMRMLTRSRVQMVGEATRLKARVIRMLELFGIKLAAIFSDVLGKSGRAVLGALLEGTKSPKEIAALVAPKMAKKRPLLERAVTVPLNEDAKWILRELLDALDHVDRRLAAVHDRIANKLACHAEDVALLQQIPGLSAVSIAGVLAETGTDMSVFTSARHLTSWAGLAPGKNQSAGKNRRARRLNGNVWLRTMLVQVAWAASRAKRSPWRQTFARLTRTTGSAKKAVFAIARKLLLTIFHVLTTREYRPMQPPPPSEVHKARRAQSAIAALTALGFEVSIKPIAATTTVLPAQS